MTVREPRLYSSFQNAVMGVTQMIEDGWKVDFDNPPDTVGFAFEVTYVYEGAPPVKKSRAEILADARAAKAAKKVSE
jgi:hypothetical protein